MTSLEPESSCPVMQNEELSKNKNYFNSSFKNKQMRPKFQRLGDMDRVDALKNQQL